MNIILNADSYKASHFKQYPPGTTHVSSYIEARGGKFEKALFFGLQMFIKTYLTKPITAEDIDEASAIFEAHGVPFNDEGWRHILTEHKGFLPVEIQAVPEGSLVPVRNVLVQIVNTDPACFWLTSYLETAILRAVWYPVTVATTSFYCKELIARYLQKTTGQLEGLAFKLHDFGARGASSEETAAIGGAAHLVNFMGTDTLSGIIAAQRYYGAEMAGFSIPAAEHSTITSWGRDGERAAYENMLDQFSGEGKLVAVVSDSYDLWHAIDTIWGEELKQKIERSGGTLVVRPDSGDPVEIVVETIERLMAKFGSKENAQGYRVLPDCIRVIQGDGVEQDSIEAILKAMVAKKLSVENIAFGMGGALLQKLDRDTMKFAMKASAAKVNGEWRDVFKDPITDKGKRSKKGRLALIENGDGSVETIREEALAEVTGQVNALQTVFRNGELLIEQSFDAVRERSEAAIGS